MFDAISTMNNEVEYVAPTHIFFLRKVIEGENCQLYRNMISSVQVFPQSARKKRFTSLDLERSCASNATTLSDTSILQEPEMDRSEDNNREPTSEQGSIGNTTALKQPIHE
jgi:hypothetical protein